LIIDLEDVMKKNIEIEVVGKKGAWLQVVVVGKDGKEKKMIMREVEKFWEEKEIEL
jgi:hypothetical protein